MAPPPPPDLTGQQFGRLVVVARGEKDPRNGKTRWLVRCECGTEKLTVHSHLVRGRTASCGCFRKSGAVKTKKTLDALATGVKVCTRCGNAKPFSEYNKYKRGSARLAPWCRECTTDARLISVYGVSLEQKRALIQEQGGRCAIHGCGRPLDAKSNIDHCHSSGQVRAILCGGCNRALGILGEDVRRIHGIAAYAESWKQLRLVPVGMGARKGT